jgi:predicted Fe-Mo cluster-binding NifX family protein
MKIAIPSKNPSVDSFIDERFGRAIQFVIYDTKTNVVATVENVQNLNAVQGAGLQSAKNVIDSGAQVVLTPHCGPKAFNLLLQFDVSVYLAKNMTVKAAVEAFLNSELEQMTSADVEGHWV